MGSERVGHDSATSLVQALYLGTIYIDSGMYTKPILFLFYFAFENSQDFAYIEYKRNELKI